MTLLTSTAAGILSPEQVGALVVKPLLESAVATIVSSVVTTDSNSYRIPIVSADPVAGWTAEGSEITASDQDVDEIDCVPKKLAALSIISNELAEDSDPSAAQVVGEGLVRDLRRKLDLAFFGNTVANGPSGLGSLVTSIVDTNGPLTSLDSFAEAQSIAETLNTQLTGFVANPTDLLALSKLKVETGSNLPLLQPDPTLPGRRQVLGIPIYSTPAVTAGTIWGIPRDRVFIVVRKDYSLEADRSAYFSSDRTGLRAIIRVGFGFADPASVVRLYNAP